MCGPLSATLTYGPFTLTGVLKSVKLMPGFEGYIPYHATFEPDTDTTAQAAPPQQAPTQAAAVSQSVNAAQQAALNALENTSTLGVQSLSSNLTTALSVVSPTTYAASASTMTAQANLQFAYLSNNPNMADVGLVLNMYVATSILASALGSLTASNYCGRSVWTRRTSTSWLPGTSVTPTSGRRSQPRTTSSPR